MIRVIFIITVFILSLSAKSEITGYYANNKEVKSFINYMIRKYNFRRDYLIKTFSCAAKPKRYRTKKRARRVKLGIAKGHKWWLKSVGYTKYEKRYLNEDRVKQGVKFVKRYKKLLNRIEKKLKVDKYIIAAIVGIETYYGEIIGNWETFNALAYHSFKKKKRAKLFKYELEKLLVLCYRQKLKALYLKGSIYGALGLGQLMPHSYLKYGLSYDGNRRIEPFSYPDAIATVANFLHHKGWISGKEVAIRASYHGKKFNLIKKSTKYKISRKSLKKWGIKARKKFKAKYFKLTKLKRAEFDELWITFNNFDVLKHYNNSDYYAMAVYQLAQEIKKREVLSTRKKVAYGIK